MGLVVHIAMLAILLLLPSTVVLRVITQLGPLLVLVYPVATMLVSLLFQDYADQEANRHKLHKLAYYDPLTGLPNRLFLMEQLREGLRQPRKENSLVLILINLDRFKMLNDARGHVVGDQLLRALTERLPPHMVEGNVLARMSADEFAVLLKTPMEYFKDVNLWGRQMAEKLQFSIKYPFDLGEDEISISSSMGITSFPLGKDDAASNILRRADTAMHRAKQNGGNQCVVFELDMASSVEYKYQIDRELRKAIPAGELVLYMQSQVDAAGNIVGAETLVRWQHPQRGLGSSYDVHPHCGRVRPHH